jgi:hypothetical protein
MPRKSCHKAVKLTCGDEYDTIVKTAKSKYHEDISEVFRYENGAIGVFLKSGKFRFVQGSNPETLAKLRSKRKSSSKKGGSHKRKSSKKQRGGENDETAVTGGKRRSSKKQRGGENDEMPVTGGKRRSSKKQRGGEQTLDNLMTKLDNLTTTNEVSTTDMPMQDGGAKKKQLNLKNAVQLLRKYYSEKFRK